MFDVRRDAMFEEGRRTRISAVVAYERRRYTSDSGPFKMTVLHNPYARFPLPMQWLVEAHVRHIRRVEHEPGRYHFDIQPSR